MNNEDTNTGTTSETSSFSIDSWLKMIKMKTLIVMFAVIAAKFYMRLPLILIHNYTDTIIVRNILFGHIECSRTHSLHGDLHGWSCQNNTVFDRTFSPFIICSGYK